MNQEEPSGVWGDEGKDRKKDEEKMEWEEGKDEEKMATGCWCEKSVYTCVAFVSCVHIFFTLMCVNVCMCVCVPTRQGALCTSSMAEQLSYTQVPLGKRAGYLWVTYRQVSYQHQTEGRDKHLYIYFQSLFEIVSREFYTVIVFPEELRNITEQKRQHSQINA